MYSCSEISNPKDYKVALYMRLSKEDESEAESQSVTNQRSMLRGFSEKHQLDVYKEYIDDGFSGGDYNRPAFNRLIKDIEAKNVNMIITKDMSRLGRDYIQTGYYMEKYFPEKRVRYISLLDGVDTGVDSSINDITPFKAIMNDMYAKDISKKIKSAKHENQRKGLFNGGKAPYGYMLSKEQKNTLIIDEKAAEIVQKIFQMALVGKSCRAIASILNEQNIPSPAIYANLTKPSRKGPYFGLWSSERVTYTLKNQMYIGNMVQGTIKKVNYKSKKYIKTPKEQWVVVEDTHPAIVEKSDFFKVQLLIDSRKRTRARIYDFLLKGMIFCKECGYPLGVINRALSDGEPSLYFVCRTYQRFTKSGLCSCHCVRVETVTSVIVEQIRLLCRQNIDKREFKDIAETIVCEAKSNNRQDIEMRRLSSLIEKTTSNIDKLYSDKLSGLLLDNDFQRLYTKLTEDRSALQDKLDILQKSLLENEELVYDADEFIEQFIESADQNRELLCSLVEKIELTEHKEIHIHFRCHLQ